MGISIKISEDNYEWLCNLSGDLRKELHRPVSINEALSHLRREKISDIAGTLKMDDKEVEDFFRGLKKGWKKWTIKSV